MNHQTFEEWLFSEEPLTAQQEQALQEHLGACVACRQLAGAWEELSPTLQSASLAEPQPGFTERWQIRLEADRQRMQRRQSLAMLTFSLAGAAMLFGSLAILLVPSLENPKILLLNWMYRLLSLVAVVNNFQELVETILKTVGGVIPWGIWILLAGLLTELSVLWVVSLRLLINPRRVTK